QIHETALLRGEVARVRGQLVLARQDLHAARAETAGLSQRVEQQTGETARLRTNLRAHDQLLIAALVLSLVAFAVAVARGRALASVTSGRFVGEMRDRLQHAE